MSKNRNWKLLEQIEIGIDKLSDSIESLDKGDIHRVLITLPNKQRMPLALICYENTKYITRKGYKEVFVEIESLKPENVDFAETVLAMLLSFHNNGNRDLTSKFRYLRDFISRLKLTNTSLNLVSARNVLKEFVNELREDVRKFVPPNWDTGEPGRGLSNQYCAARQSIAIEFLALHLKVTDGELTSGINLIRQKRNRQAKTLPLSETELAREFNFYTSLFRVIASAILNHEMFPKKIELVEGDYWIMPYTTWAIPNSSSPEGRSLPYVNYKDGTFYTPGELLSKYNCSALNSPKKRGSVLRGWLRNNEEFSEVRQRLITAATKAYYLHFLIITAMNDAPAASLLYSSSYSTEKSKQNFVTIKWKAASKKVSFAIQSEFLDDFKTYLKLREYVLKKLGEPNYKYLFIGSIKLGLKHLRLNGGASATIRKSFEKIAPFNLNGNRKIRITKGLWVRRRYGVSISAYVLQHSLSTSITSYSGTDPETTKLELTKFYDQINDIHLKREESTPTESGNCIDIQSPDFMDKTPESLKLCGKGCLFCNNFRVHTDKVDLHKLYSCLFVILQLKALAHDKTHWEETYNPLVVRIESLVESIVLTDIETLAKVKQQVFILVFQEQVLTTYWANKLQLLSDLGVL